MFHILLSAVRFIADDTATFSQSIGLAFDASPILGGTRSLVRLHSHRLIMTTADFVWSFPVMQRYVIVTDEDKVASLAVEPDPSKITVTAASAVLASL